MSTYYVKRVIYGKKNVPFEQREFSAFMGGPVGCANEIIDFIKQKMPYIHTIVFEDHIEKEEYVYDVKTSSLKKNKITI